MAKRYLGDPYDWAFAVAFFHNGPDYPVPGVIHQGWVYPLAMLPPLGITSCFVVHVTEEEALLDLAAMAACPRTVQRCCIYCHPGRPGNIVPRWNEYGGSQPEFVVPVEVVDWMAP